MRRVFWGGFPGWVKSWKAGDLTAWNSGCQFPAAPYPQETAELGSRGASVERSKADPMLGGIGGSVLGQNRLFANRPSQPPRCIPAQSRPTGAFPQQETFAITIGGKGLRQIFKRCSESGKGKTTAK